MSDEELIKEFLEKHIDHNDFGYLVICRDDCFIQEAVENIRKAFNEFKQKVNPIEEQVIIDDSLPF